MRRLSAPNKTYSLLDHPKEVEVYSALLGGFDNPHCRCAHDDRPCVPVILQRSTSLLLLHGVVRSDEHVTSLAALVGEGKVRRRLRRAIRLT